jgi:hypothetical protein
MLHLEGVMLIVGLTASLGGIFLFFISNWIEPHARLFRTVIGIAWGSALVSALRAFTVSTFS